MNLTPQNFFVYKNHLLAKAERNYLTTYPLKKKYYYLELVIPLQAESPRGKTSELLRHLSDQATVTHRVKVKSLLTPANKKLAENILNWNWTCTQPYCYSDTGKKPRVTTKLNGHRMFLKIRLKSHNTASQICRETEPEIPLLSLLNT